MKYTVRKTVKCETDCRNPSPAGYGYGNGPYDDVNKAYRIAELITKQNGYDKCGCRCEVVEIAE